MGRIRGESIAALTAIALGCVGDPVSFNGARFRCDEKAPVCPDNTECIGGFCENSDKQRPSPPNDPVDEFLPDAGTAIDATIAGPNFEEGFESATLDAWTNHRGLTVTKTDVASGLYALEANTTNGETYAKVTLAKAYLNAEIALSFKIASKNDQVNILRLRTSADGSIGYLGVDSAGFLLMHINAEGKTYFSQTQVGAGWHELSWDVVIAGAASQSVVELDGIAMVDFPQQPQLGNSGIERLQIGEVQNGRTYHVFFDDISFKAR